MFMKILKTSLRIGGEEKLLSAAACCNDTTRLCLTVGNTVISFSNQMSSLPRVTLEFMIQRLILELIMALRNVSKLH